jgi:hypothetical protein
VVLMYLAQEREEFRILIKSILKLRLYTRSIMTFHIKGQNIEFLQDSIASFCCVKCFVVLKNTSFFRPKKCCFKMFRYYVSIELSTTLLNVWNQTLILKINYWNRSWGRDFPHPSRPVVALTQLPIHLVPGLYRG